MGGSDLSRAGGTRRYPPRGRGNYAPGPTLSRRRSAARHGRAAKRRPHRSTQDRALGGVLLPAQPPSVELRSRSHNKTSTAPGHSVAFCLDFYQPRRDATIQFYRTQPWNAPFRPRGRRPPWFLRNALRVHHRPWPPRRRGWPAVRSRPAMHDGAPCDPTPRGPHEPCRRSCDRQAPSIPPPQVMRRSAKGTGWRSM
jgi:hypothetical protein